MVSNNEQETIHYPVQAEENRANHILRVQIALCLLIGLLLWSFGRLAPDGKAELMENYRNYMVSHRWLEKEEILRFVGSFSIPDIPMGGGMQTERPENYAEEAYQPSREINQPLNNYWVTSEYGWRDNPLADGKDFHTGIDLAAGQGTPVNAALPGIVLKAGYSKSYGNYILLSHGEEDFTLYAHMQYLFARVGQQVKQGQMLGTVGATGAATGPHLHFELFHLDTGYDPAKALGL